MKWKKLSESQPIFATGHNFLDSAYAYLIFLIQRLISTFCCMYLIQILNMEDDNPGCAPPILRTIDLKMTIVLIGISIAFILLTIPHRFLVVNATLNNLRIEELPVAITRQFCHINFSCNSIFYFFLASECREELRKTCACK